MRAMLWFRLLAPVALATALVACDQDYASSNPERHTFMGDAQAAAPATVDVAPTTPPSIAPPPPPMVNGTLGMPAPVVASDAAAPDAAPAASAAASASAAAPAHPPV